MEGYTAEANKADYDVRIARLEGIGDGYVGCMGREM